MTPFPTVVPSWFLHTNQNTVNQNNLSNSFLFERLKCEATTLLQDFFSSYGLSLSNVKLMAGLGLMTTCLGLTMFLLYLCSRRLRGTQVSVGRHWGWADNICCSWRLSWCPGGRSSRRRCSLRVMRKLLRSTVTACPVTGRSARGRLCQGDREQTFVVRMLDVKSGE